MNDYLFEYRHGGASWGITIRAKDKHDAFERLKSLAWAKYQGEVVATIPVSFGPFAKLAAWVRNFFYGRAT